MRPLVCPPAIPGDFIEDDGDGDYMDVEDDVMAEDEQAGGSGKKRKAGGARAHDGLLNLQSPFCAASERPDLW